MITLREIKISDFEEVLKWSKDRHFCFASGWDVTRTEDELFQWWRHCVYNLTENFIRLGIEYHGKIIGYADLLCINNNCAEIGITIGDSSLWGKAIGSNALIKLMKEAAENREITTFLAETHETNIRSQKMLEKLGFKEIGRNGSEIYAGQECSLIQYSLLKNK